MSQKLLIIVLVVLVLIFLITLGMAGCHGSGTPSPNKAGAVGALKGLQGNRFLVIGDKASTNCAVINAVTLRVSGQCFIALQKRAFFRKSTRVAFRNCIDPPRCTTPSAFPSFQVDVNPRKGPTQSDQIAGKMCYGTSVGHAGGTITLTGNTTITLQRPACPE
jgi:hypothetical protein